MKNNILKAPIGILDSGVGGLSIAQVIMEKLPNEDILYIADTKNMPYGKKTHDQVKEYTANLLEFLIQNKVKLAIIACNTATAVSQEVIQEYQKRIKIFNVIEPVVDYVIRNYAHQKVGLICTDLTCRTGIFERLIDNHDMDISLISLGASNLANLVENESERSDKIETLIREYLYHHQFRDIKAVILGCTHYIWVKDYFAKINPYIDWVEPSLLLVESVNDYLKKMNIANDNPSLTANTIQKPTAIFCQTGNQKSVFEYAHRLMPETFEKLYFADVANHQVVIKSE